MNYSNYRTEVDVKNTTSKLLRKNIFSSLRSFSVSLSVPEFRSSPSMRKRNGLLEFRVGSDGRF